MIENITTNELVMVAIAGAFGSLVKDILVDGCIQIPEIKEKKLYLGFIGGALIGSFVGMMIDGSFLTALMAGYTGTSVVSKLVVPTTIEVTKEKDIKQNQ